MAPLRANTEALNAWKTPVQVKVDGVECRLLGWGPVPPFNLAYRQAIGKPGAPFGGMGFFDPQSADLEKCKPEQKDMLQGALNAELTSGDVYKLKTGQFQAQASGEESAYFWALQPIYDTEDAVVAAEILMRVKNGSDSAPFEDVVYLCNPSAPEEIKALYAEWKVAEILYVLATVKEHPKLEALSTSANLRPADLDPAGLIYQKLQAHISKLSDSDKALMLKAVAIEVTEDQKAPLKHTDHLKLWKELGFELHFDDAIGDLALLALKGSIDKESFHAVSMLKPMLDFFTAVKVDIEWAGYCIFLCHPAFFSPEKKKEVLDRAKESDQITLPPKGAVEGVSHRGLVDEFRVWALEMIKLEKQICVECTVRADDPNCSYALDMLKAAEQPLDIFGTHKKWFTFQGGLTKAKAFLPHVLAENLQAVSAEAPTGGYSTPN